MPPPVVEKPVVVVPPEGPPVLEPPLIDVPENGGDLPKPYEENEPVEDIEDLSIVDFQYKCMELAYMQRDSLYVFNSREDFEKYFTCENNLQIDFSTKMLLVAFGETTSGIDDFSRKLSFSDNVYFLTIDIKLLITGEIGNWNIAVITDKINTQNVVLKINKHL